MPILNIHASSIDNYLDCPRRAIANSYPKLLKEAGYEVKDTTRYVTPTIGSGIHAGADFLNQDYIRTGLLPTVDLIRQAADVAFARFRALYLKDIETNEVKYTVKFNNDDIIRAHIDEYVQLYAQVVLPGRQLEETEKHFTIPLNDNYQYTSTLDSYGNKTLYDLKTGAKITPAFAQMGTYVYLLRTTGHIVEHAQLDYCCRPKDGMPPEHIVIKYNPDECMAIAQYATARLMADLDAFQVNGDINVLLVNPRSESCNSLMCPLFGTTSCGGWRNGKY